MRTNSVNTILTKEIQSTVFSVLKEYGFETFSGRKAWKYFDNKIYLLAITGVGSNFSEVTGYPSISITSSINIYYINFPDNKECKKISKTGKRLPDETECHYRFSLEKINQQENIIKNIKHPIDKKRRDVWWIEPNGNNIESVMSDIIQAIKTQALKLVEKPCYQYEEQLSRYKNR